MRNTGEDFLRDMHDWRGVKTPCQSCAGSGVMLYGSTATWRGGMGGAMCTKDVCCHCWGSGDKDRLWTNQCEASRRQLAWKEEQCLQYLAERLGVGLSALRAKVIQLSDLCAAQTRKRKIPPGEDAFWWNSDWHALGSILKNLANGKYSKAPESSSGDGAP